MPINQDNLRYILGLYEPTYERENKNALLHLAVVLSTIQDRKDCTLANVIFFDDAPNNLQSAKRLLEPVGGKIVDLSVDALSEDLNIGDEQEQLRVVQEIMTQAGRISRQAEKNKLPNAAALKEEAEEAYTAYNELQEKFQHGPRLKNQLITKIERTLTQLLEKLKKEPSTSINVLCFDWGGVLSECLDTEDGIDYIVPDRAAPIFALLNELVNRGVKFVNASADAGKESVYAARLAQQKACPYSYSATLGTAYVYRLFTLTQTLFAILKQEHQEGKFAEIMSSLIKSAQECKGTVDSLQVVDDYHAKWMETQSKSDSKAMQSILAVLHRSLVSCKAIVSRTFNDLTPYLVNSDPTPFMTSVTAKELMVQLDFCDNINLLVTATLDELKKLQIQSGQEVVPVATLPLPVIEESIESLSTLSIIDSYEEMCTRLGHGRSTEEHNALKAELSLSSKEQRTLLRDRMIKEDPSLEKTNPPDWKQVYWAHLSPPLRTVFLRDALIEVAYDKELQESAQQQKAAAGLPADHQLGLTRKHALDQSLIEYFGLCAFKWSELLTMLSALGESTGNTLQQLAAICPQPDIWDNATREERKKFLDDPQVQQAFLTGRINSDSTLRSDVLSDPWKSRVTKWEKMSSYNEMATDLRQCCTIDQATEILSNLSLLAREERVTRGYGSKDIWWENISVEQRRESLSNAVNMAIAPHTQPNNDRTSTTVFGMFRPSQSAAAAQPPENTADSAWAIEHLKRSLVVSDQEARTMWDNMSDFERKEVLGEKSQDDGQALPPTQPHR